MKLKFFISVIIFLLIFSGFTLSSSATDNPLLDSLIKAKGKSTVYYYASDGKRYVFPNEKTYKSWFTDFSDVIEVDLETLAEIPLGGNMRYRPGVVMVKIVTNPTVYVVANNGVLRSVKSEAMAQKLYGINWNLLIDDIPDAFFVNYQIGSEVESEDDYDPDEEVENTPTINHNRKLRVTNRARWSNTTKCRAIPATPAVPAHKQGLTGRATPAIPATPARDCAHQGKKNDTTAPNISDISVTVGVTSATIGWTTNENSDSAVEYAMEPVASASATDEVSDSSLVASHEIELTGLTASTTYYFIVKSMDGNNNTATSSEQMFTTAEEPVTDTTPPVITDIVATPQTTSTVISWTTDEESTSQVEYDTESLATSTTTQSISDSAFVTSHSLELISLTASTTYYFIVESVDASSNTATSSEQIFVTLE